MLFHAVSSVHDSLATEVFGHTLPPGVTKTILHSLPCCKLLAVVREDFQKMERIYEGMLAIALAEARKGLAEGGLPIGAAIFDGNGRLLGAGRNRRVQNGDPSMHGETDAFRNAGRQRSYRDKTMVTTLAPCWYCSGLVRQFGFGTLVVGESRTFPGGLDWLRSLGIRVIDLDSEECVTLMADYIRDHPDIWKEDIGED
jgi:cytosine/creatinine deaminase